RRRSRPRHDLIWVTGTLKGGIRQDAPLFFFRERFSGGFALGGRRALRAELVFLELVLKRAPGDAEPLRGTDLVSGAFLHRLLDQPQFASLERRGEPFFEGGTALGPCPRSRYRILAELLRRQPLAELRR